MRAAFVAQLFVSDTFFPAGIKAAADSYLNELPRYLQEKRVVGISLSVD